MLQEGEDLVLLKTLIQSHVQYTSSGVGKSILANWDREVNNFVKVGGWEGGEGARAPPPPGAVGEVGRWVGGKGAGQGG